jgi:hypothetical protein
LPEFEKTGCVQEEKECQSHLSGKRKKKAEVKKKAKQILISFKLKLRRECKLIFFNFRW